MDEAIDATKDTLKSVVVDVVMEQRCGVASLSGLLHGEQALLPKSCLEEKVPIRGPAGRPTHARKLSVT